MMPRPRRRCLGSRDDRHNCWLSQVRVRQVLQEWYALRFIKSLPAPFCLRSVSRVWPCVFTVSVPSCGQRGTRCQDGKWREVGHAWLSGLCRAASLLQEYSHFLQNKCYTVLQVHKSSLQPLFAPG